MLNQKNLRATLAVEAQWGLGKAILRMQMTEKNEGEMSIEAFIYLSDAFVPTTSIMNQAVHDTNYLNYTGGRNLLFDNPPWTPVHALRAIPQ